MNNIKCCITIFMLTMILSSLWADDAPPDSVNTIKIAIAGEKHFRKYSNWHIIGFCTWIQHHWYGPTVSTTTEISEYIPDLVVTVYNDYSDNPWTLANRTLDPFAHKLSSKVVKELTGSELTDGNFQATNQRMGSNSVATKSVDVVGSPINMIRIPKASLRRDTMTLKPYFHSDLDVISDRTGIAEAIRSETWNPFSHYIGSSFANHWGYEFPRSMTVDNNNDYKASVIIAQHAADIVTNKNRLHVTRSTSNSCGEKCTVANVIDNDSDHDKWQEVYPHDHLVHLGQSDQSSVKPIRQSDIQAGHGNYVFLVWRHYRGCVQGRGHVIYNSAHIDDYHKR